MTREPPEPATSSGTGAPLPSARLLAAEPSALRHDPGPCGPGVGRCSRLTPASSSSNGSTVRAEQLRMNVRRRTANLARSSGGCCRSTSACRRTWPWQGKTVFTGVFKDPVAGPRRVRRLNVEGDGQGDLAGHGGEQRAVFVYQIDSYRYWERELGRNDFATASSARTSPWKDSPMTRSASAIATRSALPSSRSRNPGSPATASGSA